MKRVSPYGSRVADYDSTMTPMIDVVFLLLVFFVWTASFRLAELNLPSELAPPIGTTDTDPLLAPPPEKDFDEIVIRLVSEGESIAWRLNEVPMVDRAEVTERLKAIAAIRRDAPVIVHPDPLVPLGAALDAFDAARLAGFDAVQFAVEETGP
ncbi:MAG TPA: biopolymer transporter ExbD [Planctomycetaceae bacterium]|nr:biopolymer transporter ExbD [Planctomycetaceae bacterium]HRF02569.1 biopolymer transporter ExbD [Pirellulaceae bacterium]